MPAVAGLVSVPVVAPGVAPAPAVSEVCGVALALALAEVEGRALPVWCVVVLGCALPLVWPGWPGWALAEVCAEALGCGEWLSNGLVGAALGWRVVSVGATA